jgi:hypothetical protein
MGPIRTAHGTVRLAAAVLGRNSAEDLMPYIDSLVDEAVRIDRVTILSQPAAVGVQKSLRKTAALYMNRSTWNDSYTIGTGDDSR